MIKTLRITSIFVAIISACFLIFPVVFAGDSSQRLAEILNSESAIEKFKKSKTHEGKDSKSQTAPLVTEAREFALYLNPPAIPKPAPAAAIIPTGRQPRVSVRPEQSSVKFSLLGTSFYPQNQDLSLALIDVPGKGFKWVRQSEKVGHLIIEKIGDGSIIVKDGKKTTELFAERRRKISLVKNAKSAKQTTSKTATITSTVYSVPQEKQAAATEARPQIQMSDDQRQAMLKKMFMELMETESGKQPAEYDSNSPAENIRLNSDEAKNLEQMGKESKAPQPDPNRPKSKKTEKSKDSDKPSRGSKKSRRGPGRI